MNKPRGRPRKTAGPEQPAAPEQLVSLQAIYRTPFGWGRRVYAVPVDILDALVKYEIKRDVGASRRITVDRMSGHVNNLSPCVLDE